MIHIRHAYRISQSSSHIIDKYEHLSFFMQLYNTTSSRFPEPL